MQKIIPHLWFDTEAKAAAEFYTTVFPEAVVNHVTTLTGTPSGDADIVSFSVMGYEFMAISAGPYFTINPAISFMVNFDPAQDGEAKAHLDAVWQKLCEGGKVLMPLQEYPFSKWYGWVEDKYGVYWQLILTNPEGEPRPRIMPALLFTKNACGQAEAATDRYLEIFPDSKRGALVRYPAGMEPDTEGTVMFTDLMLAGQWFVAMDSAHQHAFGFNEGVSLLVQCETQDEIDYFSNALSAVPEAEQCGWLKDKYGVSWQITPTRMNEMMRTGTPEQIARLTAAFLPMKRFDLAMLERAFTGE